MTNPTTNDPSPPQPHSLPSPMDLDPPPTTTTTTTSTTTKRKKPSHTLHTSTHINPPWTYFTLRLTTSPPLPLAPSTTTTTTTSLDPLTTRTLLTTPLHAYLGLTGSSIPLDILLISGVDVTLRVPREDARGFRAAVGSWVGGGVERGVLLSGDEEGGGGKERVQVSWRVVREVGAAGGLVGDRDAGMGLFG